MALVDEVLVFADGLVVEGHGTYLVPQAVETFSPVSAFR